MAIVQTGLAILGITSLLLFLIAQATAHVALSRRRRKDGPTPPISVLKPLKGLDDGLYENLAALARQDYPDFEILFGAEDPDDPALAVARRVRDDFPSVAIRVVHCARPIGLNPKVNNLAALSSMAQHDLILVSDSNVRPDRGYLRAIASELQDPRVGMVSSILTGTGERSLGALFENLHLNSFIAASVSVVQTLARRACVVGKSMLFRRSHLHRIGGWRSVRDILAEDYVLGERFQKAGYRVVLSPHVVPTVNETWPLSRFINRHLRWALLRRWISPPAYLLEVLGNPVPFLGALLLLTLSGSDSASHPAAETTTTLALSGIALKWFSDEVLARRLRGRGYGLTGILAVACKDVLVVGIWSLAWIIRTVEWRGHRMRIGPGSRLSPADSGGEGLPAPDGQVAPSA